MSEVQAAAVPLGIVEIVFNDTSGSEPLRIFRASFATEERLNKAWERLPAVAGYSAFRALLRAPSGEVLATHGVDYKLIETITEIPVAVSMNRARSIRYRLA